MSIKTAKKFRYEEIADYIAEAINEGTIKFGNRLPSLRKTSKRFNCSISVAMQAYQELEKSGKVYAVEKSGFFASRPVENPRPATNAESYSLRSEEAKPLSIIGKIVDASNDKRIVPLGAGIPHESLLPISAVKQSLNRVLRENPLLINQYSDEAGYLGLRTEICRILLNRGVNAGPDEILITNGCTEALSLAVQSATSEGDTVAIESPVFMGAIQILKELGRKIITIPTSAERGIDLDLLETAARQGDVKAVMMTAAFQNPLGFVMPEENRKKAVELAEKYNFTIIEDDLYSDCSHNYTAERPLKSFDRRGIVIYCSSFSKTLSPGLRIGWMIGGLYQRKCRKLKITQNLGGSPVLQAAMADFLKNGRYVNHVKKFQKSIARQALEMKILLSGYFPDNTAISTPCGGFFFWLEINGEIDTVMLFRKALDEKISIAPGEVFGNGGRFRNCLRISFAYPVTESIRDGIRKLGDMIKKEIK